MSTPRHGIVLLLCLVCFTAALIGASPSPAVAGGDGAATPHFVLANSEHSTGTDSDDTAIIIQENVVLDIDVSEEENVDVWVKIVALLLAGLLCFAIIFVVYWQWRKAHL